MCQYLAAYFYKIKKMNKNNMLSVKNNCATPNIPAGIPQRKINNPRTLAQLSDALTIEFV